MFNRDVSNPRPGLRYLLWLASALALGAFSLTLTACLGPRDPGALPGTLPGIQPGRRGPARPAASLTLALPSLPQGLDPALSAERDTRRVVSAIFDTLVRHKTGGPGFEPGLALWWSSDREQRVWTFVLRRGVKFHDGTELNADAVVYSLSRLLPPGGTAEMPLAGAFFDPTVVDAVEKADDQTVRIVLRRPYPALLSRLAAPLPSAIISPTAHRADPIGFGARPIGTGPYILDRREGDGAVVLRANREYWMGPPATGQIIFRAMPESPVRLEALTTGAVDAAFDLGPDELARAGAQNDQATKGLQVRRGPGNSLILLGFKPGTPGDASPWGGTLARRAVAGAVYRTGLANNIFKGAAQAAGGPVPPEVPGYDPNPAPYEIRGGSLRDGSPPVGGTVYGGYRFDLNVYSTPTPFDPIPGRVADSLKADLAKGGAQARIVYNPWEAHEKWVFDPKTSGVFLYGFQAGGGDPADFLTPLFHSAGLAAGTNPFGYRNPRVDALLDQAAREPNAEHRAGLYIEAQRLIAADAPAVPLIYPFETSVQSRDLTGLEWHPVGGLRLSDAWKPKNDVN